MTGGIGVEKCVEGLQTASLPAMKFSYMNLCVRGCALLSGKGEG